MEDEPRERRITCVIADDHDGLRHGVATYLRAEPDLDVIGETSAGDRVVSLVERRRPDVAIVDLRMPDHSGIEVCSELIERGLPTAVVLYTGHTDAEDLVQALDAGARSIVLKGSPLSELTRAVRMAVSGQVYVDAAIAASLLGARQLASGRLSPREREVLQLLSTGLSTAEAGRQLFLSAGTVQDYAESAMRKLGARNRVHAVAIAVLEGIIEGPSAAPVHTAAPTERL